MRNSPRKVIPSFLQGRLHRSATAPDALRQPLTRIFKVDNGAVDKEARTVEVCFFTETPISRWGITEILSADREAVDLSRLNDGASVLFNHKLDDYIGVVENARVDTDRKGRAVLRFGTGERASRVFDDIQTGLLRNVSVGYEVKEWQITEKPGVPDTYTAKRWEAYEISIVTVPADPKAGVGRSANFSTTTNPPETKNTMTRAQIIALLKLRGINVAEDISDNDLQSLLSRALSAPDEAKKLLVANHAAIRKIAEEYGKTVPNATDLALRAIADGNSAEQFQAVLLAELHKARTKTVTENATVGLTGAEAGSFRFIRLINHLADPTNHAAREAAKFELEVVEAARSKGMGKRGIPIPFDVLARALYKRDAATGTIISVGATTDTLGTGTGNALVETQLLVGNFIELLQNESKILGLAAKINDLHGNIDIPREDTIPKAYWLGENDTVPKSVANFSTFGITPKTIAALCPITRKMLIQSSISMEVYVRRKIAEILGLGIDLAAIYGTGASNQPQGILKTPGLNVVDFADVNPTYAELVAMETELAGANALRGNLAYLANSAFRGYAKTTKKFPTSGTDATIWEPGGTVNGTRAEITNQLELGDLLYGNFNDFLFAIWAGMELLAEREINTGALSLAIYQDVDFRVLRGESFTYGRKPAPTEP